MKVYKPVIWLIILCFFSSGYVNAQTIPKDELIFLTSQRKGERFADGRLRVPDDFYKEPGALILMMHGRF